jgi:hypothetical protein
MKHLIAFILMAWLALAAGILLSIALAVLS